jgi:glycerol uptake facilitator-like aquaporin
MLNINLFFTNIIMNKLLAEFLGTLFFLYVILAAPSGSKAAVAIGVALAIAIMMFGKVSGGNFNPAVTVMMVAKGAQPAADLLPYIVAQVAGGLAALELYKRVKL